MRIAKRTGTQKASLRAWETGEVSDSVSTRQKKLALELKKINPSLGDPDSVAKGLFAALQQEVSFQAGWLSPRDLDASQVVSFDPVFWTGVAPPAADPTLFPMLDRLRQTGDLCVRGENWWRPSDLKKNAFYQKVLKPAGLYFALFVLLTDHDREPAGSLVLWKEKRRGDFTPADLSLMASLSPAVGSLILALSERLPSEPPNISQISDEELGALVRRRAQPGVLILDQDGEIRYLNPDARRLLQALTIKSSRDKTGFLSLPHAIEQLYRQFREVIRSGQEGADLSPQTVNRICIYEEAVYLFRALALQPQEGRNANAHILILIERVSQGLPVDQVIQSTKLTQREQSVVRLLLEGKTNKEVAGAMHIGEYTVKDHVKRIMKKLQVGTRAGIVAKILQQSRPS